MCLGLGCLVKLSLRIRLFKWPWFLLEFPVLHLHLKQTTKPPQDSSAFPYETFFVLLILILDDQRDDHYTNHVFFLLVLLRLPVRSSRLRASLYLLPVRYDALRRLLHWDQLFRRHNTLLLARVACLSLCHKFPNFPRHTRNSIGSHATHHEPHNNFQPGPVAIPGQWIDNIWHHDSWRNIHVLLLPVQRRPQGLQCSTAMCHVQSYRLRILQASQ